MYVFNDSNLLTAWKHVDNTVYSSKYSWAWKHVDNIATVQNIVGFGVSVGSYFQNIFSYLCTHNYLQNTTTNPHK